MAMTSRSSQQLSAQWRRLPAAWAFSFMILIATLYEPVRLSLLSRFRHYIGGVGGVGGLTNLAGPQACNTTQYHDSYCYQKGMDGGPFTPMAWTMILLWIFPLVLAASVMCFVALVYGNSLQVTSTMNSTQDAPLPPLGLLAMVWIGLNLLWFAVPFGVFGTGMSEVDGSPLSRLILALALAASHALSWNLMVAAIPVSGITSRLLNLSRPVLFECHRFISYTAAFWMVVHGFGELVYLAMVPSEGSQQSRLKRILTFSGDGEDLIYFLGIVTLLIFLVHTTVAFCRKHEIVKTVFRSLHRWLALFLIVLAAAHWWPFVLFLIPAIALHGSGIAYNFLSLASSGTENNNNNATAKSLCTVPKNVSNGQVGFLVILSTFASLMGTYTIWLARQSYMLSDKANLYVPFVFPPLTVITSLMASILFSMAYLAYGCGIGRHGTDGATAGMDTTPLLLETETPFDSDENGNESNTTTHATNQFV